MSEGERRWDLRLLVLVSACAVGLRSYYVSKVFREGNVVLIQVDPYYYRFRLDRLTATVRGPLDLGAFVDPGRDDLLLTVLGWTAELFGGGVRVTGTVLAVYPVVVGAVSCPIAYLAARRLTGDRWAGVAAAAVLAVAPAHVYRTALGFGDHHAFDYLLLGITFLALLVLVCPESDSRARRWSVTTVLGTALAAQALAWVGGLILVVPAVLSLGLYLLSATRSDESPLETTAPPVAAFALATVLTAVAVDRLGWQSPEWTVVFLVPTLALGALVAVAELGSRREWPFWVTGTGLLACGSLLGALAWVRIPAIDAVLARGVEYFESITGRLAESTSMYFAGDPLVTVVSYLGLFPLLFVPLLGFLTWRAVRAHRPGWLVLTTYTWYFVVLTGIQRRFAGELALFFAVVVGAGTVPLSRLFARSDAGTVAGRVREVDRNLGYLFVLVVGVTVLVATAVAVVPQTMDDRVVTDAEYETTQHLRTYSEQRGWDRSDAYVFSSKVTNRMYNYFAHGREVGLHYAARAYPDFVLSDDAESWYYRLRSRGTGFVVVSDGHTVRSPDALQTRLLDDLGTSTERGDGLEHYQLVFRSEDGSVAVFRPVAGALVSGTAPANSVVRIRTTVSVPGAEFTYAREVTATPAGTYAAVVPYAGRYTANVTAGSRHADVSEAAVVHGRTVRTQQSVAHWSFDGLTGGGTVAVDRLGGNHAVVRNGSLGDGIRHSGLHLDGEGSVAVRDTAAFADFDELTLSVWFRTRNDTDYKHEVQFPRLVSTASSGRYNRSAGVVISLRFGRVIAALGNGTGASVLEGPRTDDGRWHRATLTWNGTHCRLFVDGETRDTADCFDAPPSQHPLFVGATTDREGRFTGSIDEVRLVNRSLSPETVQRRYNRTLRERE